LERGKKGGNTQPKRRQKSDDVTTVDKETDREARGNYCLNWTGNRLQDGTYLFWRGKGREGKGVYRVRTRPKFVFHFAVDCSTRRPLKTRLNHNNNSNNNNTRSHSLTDTNPIHLYDTCFDQVAVQCRPPLWSSGQSFWLQIQRSRVRSPALPDFLSSGGSGTGSTQPREVN
jgi:hypothetical protein